MFIEKGSRDGMNPEGVAYFDIDSNTIRRGFRKIEPGS